MTAAAALALWLLGPAPAAAQPLAGAELQGSFVSNAYLDRSEEADGVLVPELTAGYGLGPWEVGYAGRLDWWLEHADLRSHAHEVFADAVVHGADGAVAREHGVRLQVSSLFNAAAFATLDHVTPALRARSLLDPAPSVSLDLDGEVNYRRFLDDAASSHVNAFVAAEPGVHLESRTTVLLRLGYGLRAYPQAQAGPTFGPMRHHRMHTAAGDQLAHQLDLRLRVAQGLGARVGVRLEHAARWVRPAAADVPQDLGLLPPALTEDFRFHRQRPALRVSVRIGEHLSGWIEGAYERRVYEGVAALDAAGLPDPRGQDRVDDRVGGTLELRWRWGGEDGPELDVTLRYRYERVASTAALYRFDQHQVGLGAAASL